MSWWERVEGPRLAQGDLLEDCLVPIFADLPVPGPVLGDEPVVEIEVKRARLVVLTQTCDLQNDKADFVALRRIYRIAEFAKANPKGAKADFWENVRKGRIEALHLLASPLRPDDNADAYVADFGRIVGLPQTYLARHADASEERWRLRSPYLEHFSQALARFFMRVGLPSSIPPFTKR